MTNATIGDNATKQLKSYVERVERLHEERKALGDDISDIYREAKGTGLDVKAMKTVIRLRGQDPDKRREHEAIVETYLHALGDAL
jgi:uncharacterized protein (UPF0335 family)